MVNRGCNKPGYTGETCTIRKCLWLLKIIPKLYSALCPAQNPYVPNNDATDDVAIDAYNLANCTETYVVAVDETMWNIKIEVETESALNPTFYLQSENGDLIFPDSDSQRPTSYIATYDFLQPGQYQLGPRADLGVSFCTMMMTARTSIKISGGFASGYQSERNDFPNLKYTYFDTASTVAVHMQGLDFPGQIQGIGFTGAENHISRYEPMGLRYNCTFPYIYERYTCARTSNNDNGHNFLQVNLDCCEVIF